MRVIEQIRSIHAKRQKGKEMASQVAKFERFQGEIYKKERNTATIAKEQLELQQKNDRLLEMRNKKRVRIGKQPMIRSTKPSHKKKVVQKEIDPEQLAFLLYLGNLDQDNDTSIAKK